MRTFFLFLALVCAAQALLVPFQRFTGRVVRAATSSSSSRMEMVSTSSQVCSMSGLMSSCRCASCRSSSSSRHHRPASNNRLRVTALQMTATLPDPTPGSPVLKNVNKATNVAVMAVALSGEQTQSAFTKSCEMYNEEVKERGYKVSGFRKGAKLPPAYLYQMFGEDSVKRLCGNLLAEEIQDECEKTGLMFVGRGRITEFNEKSFTPGKPHVLEIECDLWPEIKYGAAGSNGYKGLKVTVTANAIDMEKYGQVKENIRGRYKELSPTPMGYAAQMGDVLTANMKGYETLPDGSKGVALPAVAGGDGVEIGLEAGKFMEGMVEALVGATAGETRSVAVKFPIRPTGPGAALSGKDATFEVQVVAVKTKTIPEWDEKLAGRVRDGMTLKELEQEIVEAIEGDSKSSRENARNDALAQALLDITEMSIIPESLVEETTQMRFQAMLTDFKQQGAAQEQIAEMATPEKYVRYKEISLPNVEKIVKLGMAFRDIAEKEKIEVSPSEIREQIDVLTVQAKQKGEPVPDEARAKDEIENALLRKKVFDMLASHADITWVEAELTDAPAQA